MTTKPKTAGSSAAPRQRNRTLVILDIVVGAVFALIGLYYAFVFATIVQFAGSHQGFSIPYKILTVAAWAAGAIVFVRFALRGRVSFYWPIVGILLIIGVTFVLVTIAGASR
jgi:hypothetical protein